MRAFLGLTLCVLAGTSQAAPRADKVSWQDKGTDFDGYLVWDDSSTAVRPGVLMVPNWYGVNEHAIEKAKTLAGQDYVILLVDMYGRGVRPANPEQAGKATEAVYADATTARSRAAAALAVLKGAASGEGSSRAPVDANRIAAIGFCFGGAVALELARGGADIAAVATFHGNLSTKLPAAQDAVKARVLVMNGAEDKFVSAESIGAFKDEMRTAKADWQFVDFGGAVHCFAEPDEDGSLPGCQFHEPSYRRSVAMMRAHLAESFAANRE